MLISCIMVTAMFSVALTQKQGSGKSDRRMLSNQGAAVVSALLKDFVTGCDCNPATGACGPDCALIEGPNKFRSPGVGTWYMNGHAGVVVDSMGDVYALRYGLHTLRGLLPAWLEAAPYNGRVNYTVTPAQAAVLGRPVPQVVVDVHWDEP